MPDLSVSNWVDVEATSVTFLSNSTSLAQSESSEDEPYWPLGWRVTLAVCLALIMASAIVGNALVIVVVVRNRGMRTRTNLFLCNLAVADFLCAVIDMPFSLVTVATGRWIFNDVICQLNGFALPFLFVASIHTMMYMSIHKYLSLASPFRRSLSTRCVVAMMTAAWLWAAAIGAATVSPLTEVLYKPGTTQCGPRYPHDLPSIAHFVAVVATCYAIPLLVVGVCNARTFAVIRGHGSRLRLHTTEEWRRISAQQRRIAVTLLLVVVSFAVAWTPWVGYALYVMFAQRRHIQPPAIVNPIIYWCIYMSSVCNPLIYALRSQAFLDGYKQVFCTAGKKFGDDESSTGQRRSTLTRPPHCIDRPPDRRTTAAAAGVAMLNDAVLSSPEGPAGGQWGSLDRSRRRRRRPRQQRGVWTVANDDERALEFGYDCDDAADEFPYDEVRFSGRDAGMSETAPPIDKDFDVSAMQLADDDRRFSRSPLNRASERRLDVEKVPNGGRTGAKTLPRSAAPIYDDSAPVSVHRASSEGDFVSADDSLALRRNRRLLSCASALFGRLLTPAKRRAPSAAGSAEDDSRHLSRSGVVGGSDRQRASRQLSATSSAADPATAAASTFIDEPPSSTWFTDDSKSMSDVVRNRPSHGSQAGISPPRSTSDERPTPSDNDGEPDPMQRTRSKKKPPASTIRRFPSMERLDQPRRRAATGVPAKRGVDGGDERRSPYGADRKHAERFRRQYVDVKLQRRAAATAPVEASAASSGSMPSGVDKCGSAAGSSGDGARPRTAATETMIVNVTFH